MKGFEIKINNEQPIGVELNGVVSVTILYHNGKASVTVSGLQKNGTNNNEKLFWQDQQLEDQDNVNIKFTENLMVKTMPKAITGLDTQSQNEMKLRNYYAMKKDLEESNLL